MLLPTKLSIVLPVRDGEDQIAAEVERVLDAVTLWIEATTEVIVVDDGSRDGTPEVLQTLQARYPQLRVARHSRPRGLEAAGQTGLEKAVGELVFIQESDAPLRLEDLRRLYEMSSDPSVVAARAQSTPRPLSGPLMRRLKAFGAHAESDDQRTSQTQPGIQMVRRPHLQQLAAPAGKSMQLQANRIVSTSWS